MNFAEGNIYHVYNRGNNSQTVFFDHENYMFFLEKIRTHILPHADILAWCLMPNHFHLMISVKQVEISEQVISDGLSEGFTQSEALTRCTRIRTFKRFHWDYSSLIYKSQFKSNRESQDHYFRKKPKPFVSLNRRLFLRLISILISE